MIEQDLRDRILSAPETVIADQDVMRALIAANERAMGPNVVDLRGIAMGRLEDRLDRLEDTHRSVIAAAYENLSGTNQVHRAILRMLDATSFEDFLSALSGEVAQILRVDSVRLVLEAEKAADAPTREGVLSVAPPGEIAAYVSEGRTMPVRTVTLRQAISASATLYAGAPGTIRSEALMRLDFGADRLPGMLAMGAVDAHQFRPSMGTDLLAFFAGVFERTMRRWLS